MFAFIAIAIYSIIYLMPMQHREFRMEDDVIALAIKNLKKYQHRIKVLTVGPPEEADFVLVINGISELKQPDEYRNLVASLCAIQSSKGWGKLVFSRQPRMHMSSNLNGIEEDAIVVENFPERGEPGTVDIHRDRQFHLNSVANLAVQLAECGINFPGSSTYSGPNRNPA